MKTTARNAMVFAVLLGLANLSKASPPFVWGEVLDSNQTPIALNGSGRAPLFLGQSFYVRVHGSDSGGALKFLYVRLADADGDPVVVQTVNAYGSSYSHTWGPYTADEVGVWDFWMHSQNHDGGGYQWQGGAWWGDHSPDIEVFPPDTTPPSVPSSINASPLNGTSFTLNWSASTDNVGVTAYEVMQDSTSLGTVTGTSLAVSGLTEATSYAMKVRARDGALNWSAWSTAVSITTPDVSAPTTPTGLMASDITLTTLSLSWYPSADNVAVTAYEVSRDGVTIGSSTVPEFDVSGLTGATQYDFKVRAVDGSGNQSAWTAALSVSTSSDFTAPSVPSGVSASYLWGEGFHASWAASTDNIGVVQYEVGFWTGSTATSQGLTPGAGYLFWGLSPNTSYSVVVRARDAAGNWSAWSTPASVTTPVATSTDDPSNGIPDVLEGPNGWDLQGTTTEQSSSVLNLKVTEPTP